MPDPYDAVAIDGSVQLESSGPSGGYPWTAYPAASLTQNAMKAACLAAAQSVATGHSLIYASTMLVGWPDESPADDDSGLVAVPGASSAPSLSSGTARQPSTTRPVLVTVVGTWSWNITVLSTVTGSLTFKSDAASTPTTTLYAPSWSRGITVGVTIGDTGTMPVMWTYVVPPGHYYSVTAAGGATFSLREQVM